LWKSITQIIRHYKFDFRFILGKFGVIIDGDAAYGNFRWKGITQIIRQYKLNFRLSVFSPPFYDADLFHITPG
jgi:outer membrane biogenesis lipoprotein LolB